MQIFFYYIILEIVEECIHLRGHIMINEIFDGITIGNESQYKIVLETSGEFKTSFFKQVYEGARSNVQEIIESRVHRQKEDVMEKGKENKTSGNHKLNRFKSQKTMNNMIGFIGERGTGKTSSMLSFAAALEDSDYINEKGAKFVVMDSIDPTLINDNESILQVIVATLFLDVRESIQNSNGECSSHYSELVQQFDKVFKCLKNISSEKVIVKLAEMDTLEALNELASSANLRKELKILVDKFLEFKEGKESGNNFLVIPIDDLDLNIRNTDSMIDEIRKYLMLPNIIILIAAKFEQLVDSMEMAYSKEYKDLTKDKENELNEPLQSMAIRYLEKLLPMNRKNYMPNLMLED